ncbi:MAG: hypothetical protein KDM81_14955, partial [Verrucomicrobiae bacterium]|nr:hypothetical protein [Verrucomicrobiae bacterium]
NGPPSGPVSGIEVAAGGEVLLGAMPALAVCEVRLSAPGSLRGGILTFTPTAVLRGAGTVDADVLHRGAIRLDQASGPLIITGGLELAAGATLEAVIGLGPERGEAGHFDVAGDVVLGGTLKLAQASGYLPAAGDQFVIGVTAGTFSGAFAQVDDSALDAGLRAAWSAVDGELTVRLMAAP